MAAEAFLLVVCRIAAPVASSGSAFERRCGRPHDGRGEDHPSRASTPPPSWSRAGSASPSRDRCRAWAGRSLELGRRRARRPPAQPGPGAEPARRASLEEVADGRAPKHQAVDHRAPKPEEGERAAADHCGHGKSDQESTHGVPPSLETCCPHDAGASSPTGLWPPSGRLQGTLNPVAPRRRAPLRRWDGSSVGARRLGTVANAARPHPQALPSGRHWCQEGRTARWVDADVWISRVSPHAPIRTAASCQPAVARPMSVGRRDP